MESFDDSDSFVLFELANKDKLIKGEKYYIKVESKSDKYTTIYARFCYYYDEDTSEGVFSAHANYCFILDFDLDQTFIYRCVTQEEYYKKVKEKYDAKVLNIVLKSLIDESFIW
jgi:hypothetical protein